MDLGNIDDECWCCSKCSSLQLEVKVFYKLDAKRPYEDFDPSKAYCRKCGEDTVATLRDYGETLQDGDVY